MSPAVLAPIVLANVIRAVNTFWFGDADDPAYGQDRPQWFKKDPAFDREIEERFLKVIDNAAQGHLDMMAESPEGAVALVVVLDQFPRNVFRGDARAFAHDLKALAIARQSVERGFDFEVMPVMRKFLYLPFEHSEKIEDQQRAVDLFEALAEEVGDADGLAWAHKHLAIIQRFGRFPHRNAVLGRPSTAEEEQFLTQPGSSF